MAWNGFMRIFFVLIIASITSSCFDDDDDDDYYPYYNARYLEPPDDLRACAKDRSVDLIFRLDDMNEYNYLSQIAAFMAPGEFAEGKTSGDLFDDPDIPHFDKYGDGIVAIRASGIAPVAMVEYYPYYVMDEDYYEYYYYDDDYHEYWESSPLSVTDQYQYSWAILNGDAIPLEGLVGLVEETGESTEDSIDEGADCRWGEGGNLCLQNGTTYTVFIVLLDWWHNLSLTSNYVTFTPRPEIESVQLKGNGRIDCEGSESNAIDLGEGNEARLAVTTFTSCEDNYDGVTDSEATADLVLTSVPNRDTTISAELRPALVAANGASIFDLGTVADWCEKNDLPPFNNSYFRSGEEVIVIERHLYAVRTADSHYAKVWITGIDYENSAITLQAAYQVARNLPQL